MKNKRNILIVLSILFLPVVIVCIHAISENMRYYKAINYVWNGDYESADEIMVERQGCNNDKYVAEYIKYLRYRDSYWAYEFLEGIPGNYSGVFADEIKAARPVAKAKYDEQKYIEYIESLPKPITGMNVKYINMTKCKAYTDFDTEETDNGYTIYNYYWRTVKKDKLLMKVVVHDDGNEAIVKDVWIYNTDRYWNDDGSPCFEGKTLPNEISKPHQETYTPPTTTYKPKPNNNYPYNEYNVYDYYDPEDFYYDYEDDFWDYEDAEDYYEDYWEDYDY